MHSHVEFFISFCLFIWKLLLSGGSKEDEAELLKDLYDTLGNFDKEQEKFEQGYQLATKEGSPGKVNVLWK